MHHNKATEIQIHEKENTVHKKHLFFSWDTENVRIGRYKTYIVQITVKIKLCICTTV